MIIDLQLLVYIVSKIYIAPSALVLHVRVYISFPQCWRT